MLVRVPSTNSQEEEGTCGTRPVFVCGYNYPIIDPQHSLLLNRWDIALTVLLIATALISPFETAFLEPRFGPLFIFDRILDTAFAVDMVLQFFIAYSDPLRPTRTVRAPGRIIRNYLSGWFVIDLLSVFPVDVLCVMFNVKTTGGWLGLRNLKIIRVLRLIRLLRLARLTRLLDRWHTSFGFTYATLSLAKFFGLVVLCCHWMACLWGGLALMRGAGEHSWLTALQEAKGGSDEMYEGPFQIYSISLYWAIITLTSIGYGDITPQTTAEYWAATVCTSIMASIWAYVIGAVCGIVSTMEPHEMKFKNTMDNLNWLMMDRGMPHEMCKKLRRYFHETREMNRQRTERDVIDQMSPKLQGEFAAFIHKRWVKKVWYLQNMPYEIIVWTARNLNMAVYSPNEEVFSDRTLFIVRRGICVLRGKILISGDIWGEDMLLSNEALRAESQAVSMSYLSVLMLHVEDLVEIVANFPEARARLRWAQVQIAILRGVQKIAEVSLDLEKKRGVKSTDLTDEERLEFFASVLRGKYNAKLPEDNYFGVEPETPGNRTRLSERRRSTQMSLPRTGSMPVQEWSPDVAHLTSRVDVLQGALADIGQKVDRLLMASCPWEAEVCRKGSRNSAAARDLGPLVVPSASRRSAILLGRTANSKAQDDALND